MGLESFKTDGPRTYTKKSTTVTNASSNSIHIVGGIDERKTEYLKRHEVHKVFRTPESMNIELPSGGPYFICSECGKISSTYEAMLKTDLIDYIEYEWVNEAKQELIELYENMPTSKYYRGGLEDVETDDKKDSDGNASSSAKTKTKSSSSTKDKDFNSGLGSFME